MDPRLLRYYDRELQYIREMGAEFAREFPKIAGRLGLDTFECSDPYVERLLEGFAFMSARVHLQHRRRVPALHAAPARDRLPALPGADAVDGGGAAAPQPGRGDAGAGLPRAARHGAAQPARARRADRLRVPHGAGRDAVAARADPRRVHRLRRRPRRRSRCRRARAARSGSSCARRRGSTSPTSRSTTCRCSSAAPTSCRCGSTSSCMAHTIAVVARPTTRPAPWQHVITENPIERVGFEDEEALLPYGPRSFQGYRLLQEYFAFPARYLFARLPGLAAAVRRCNGLRARDPGPDRRARSRRSTARSAPRTSRSSARRRSTCSRAAPTAST